ncbi:hypothetical protein HPC62_05025 [Thermoleptolyngbya sichuanensis A183]|uniref:Uncharacterized protein n=1 Tax=Thermoleptolyngbya sichuanensis A183 TaxID=2737172 RepID=A0A6M8BG97_9CYAN|nr:hypothetical protein [Thermoleptolyngbya sichuanensis]QKD81635.1 hypothetical protein HPC62_05025 [Thermoleptolyngbya sichuanensis A183]
MRKFKEREDRTHKKLYTPISFGYLAGIQNKPVGCLAKAEIVECRSEVLNLDGKTLQKALSRGGLLRMEAISRSLQAEL